MQQVILLLLDLAFIYVLSYERMTKGNGMLCSDNFPILKSQDRKRSDKGDYYVPKKPAQRCWVIPYSLSRCRRMFLPSLVPEPLMDECI